MQHEHGIESCLLKCLGEGDGLALDREPMIEILHLMDREAHGCLLDVSRYRR